MNRKKKYRLQRFIRFILEYKLPKMVRNMTNEELIDLYQTASPLHEVMSLQDNIESSLYVWVVRAELQRRFPESMSIQFWDGISPMNFKLPKQQKKGETPWKKRKK